LPISDIKSVAVDKIDRNPWNPNVIQKEEYDALKQDMHIHGATGIDPLLISPKKFFFKAQDHKEGSTADTYIIVDGEHRWRAAKELGWKEIRCEIREISEDDAKALCYRRNRERGNIDPFKEALLFKTEVPKLSQAKIAGKYGVDQSTVSHRLSLLKIDAQIVAKAKIMPRGIITPSHLEALATLEPKDQKQVFQQYDRDRSYRQWGVKEMQEQTARVKKAREEERALAEALQTAKFPKCPKCRKGSPKRVCHKGLPWVTCSSCLDDWNLETGKRLYEPEVSTQKGLDGKSEPIRQKTIRCAHTVRELVEVFVERAKEIVPKVDIASLKVSGKLDGAQFGFDFSSYGKSVSVSWHSNALWRGFRAEEHEYRTGEKSAVDTHSSDHVEEVKQLIENAFQGKLGIESKRLKKAKTAEELIHDLHPEEPLEADTIQTTDNPKESLAADEAKRALLEED
jgi:ParB/RepB/Spo0J family partition protein